jgi:hypothetical protein
MTLESITSSKSWNPPPRGTDRTNRIPFIAFVAKYNNIYFYITAPTAAFPAGDESVAIELTSSVSDKATVIACIHTLCFFETVDHFSDQNVQEAD